MTSLEVGAGPATDVRQRANSGSGVTAANPQRPVLVARLWSGGGLVFDSEVNALSQPARVRLRPSGVASQSPGQAAQRSTDGKDGDN
jgi:hypothetical protein